MFLQVNEMSVELSSSSFSRLEAGFHTILLQQGRLLSLDVLGFLQKSRSSLQLSLANLLDMNLIRRRQHAVRKLETQGYILHQVPRSIQSSVCQ
jgi:predicted transcriptional regulator